MASMPTLVMAGRTQEGLMGLSISVSTIVEMVRD
jgi:hypothetical protein